MARFTLTVGQPPTPFSVEVERIAAARNDCQEHSGWLFGWHRIRRSHDQREDLHVYVGPLRIVVWWPKHQWRGTRAC